MLVAALLPIVAFGATNPVPAVDVNAPVASGTQCMPCHATIAGARTPGLVFEHGSHMTLSCDACHWAPAHSGGAPILPEMRSCFNCHGLKHNGVEVARSACATCHTKPRAQLRSADHTAGWKAKPHAESAKADSNRCLMCHTAASCDACHERLKLGLPPTQPAYRPILKETPHLAAAVVEPSGPVTMGQCIACHPDLDRFIPGRVIFAHASHLRKAFACVDCHASFPHGPGTTARPKMPACYQCHGLTHASLGLVATGDCSTCHPAGFVLKPADHTAEFLKHTHKVAANESPEACAMCHKPTFCTRCHQGLPARAGGPSRPKVIPADHRLASFKVSHGKSYLAQRGACGSCHDSASCEGCHVTPMPHPADFTSSHALARNLDPADCKVCHIDQSVCQECHHAGLRGAELIEKNCVHCHPLMRDRPATSIKDSGLAEHAVHFGVALKKGKPYRCEDCHVGFGYSAVRPASTQPALNQGHDLTMCYDCHGALDYRNVQIAPYPGNSLCVRCHSDLHL